MPSNTFTDSKFIDPRHIRMARSGLGLSVRDLAELAGVNKATIVRLEAGIQPARPSTIDAVRRALEEAGASFLTDEDPDTIVVAITLKDR
ncbi:MAG: helix-turn-helix domain-containing protein [Pseudomonadota bacterium]